MCIDVGRDRVKGSSVDAIFKANARLTSRKDGSVFEDNGRRCSPLFEGRARWISSVYFLVEQDCFAGDLMVNRLLGMGGERD